MGRFPRTRRRSTGRQGIAPQCPERFLCRPKPPLIETAFRLPGSGMRFAFINAWKEEWPVEFLCKVMRVTSRGLRAWRVRPMSPRQRDDMIILAHTREQHRLSLESYGRPRMTEELQEEGLNRRGPEHRSPKGGTFPSHRCKERLPGSGCVRMASRL